MVALWDASFEASHDDHERMKHKMLFYHSDEVGSWRQRHLPFAAKRSVDPRIHKTIDKMVPAFASKLTRGEIQPDMSEQTARDEH